MVRLSDNEILEVYSKCGADPNCELVTKIEPNTILIKKLKNDYSSIPTNDISNEIDGCKRQAQTD